MKLKHRLKAKKRSNQGRRRLIFKFEAPPGSTVFVAGNFNWWSPSTHQLTDQDSTGHFQRHVYVERGRIEYKFFVNGEWHIDTNCPNWYPNEFGTLNSVVVVR